MSVVVSILIAVAVAAALVLGSRFWFDRVQKRAHAQRIGIEVLNTRRWREALDLLVQGLAPDGLVQAAEVTGPSGTPMAERHLLRGRSRVLLIYKHGTSYRIGAAALLDAERRRQEAEQDEVVIATLGSLEPDTIAQAARMKVTCLDGPQVWSTVRPVIDSATRDAVDDEAAALIERPRRLSTAGAIVVALAIVFWGGDLERLAMHAAAAQDPVGAEAIATPVTVPAPGGSAPAPITAPIPDPTPAAVPAADARSDAPPGNNGDPVELARGSAAKAITALPEVARASWSSGSTLIVALRPRVSIDTGVEKTCALGADFPVVREARLQIETDGGEIRWRRCP